VAIYYCITLIKYALLGQMNGEGRKKRKIKNGASFTHTKKNILLS
jgi:hypothetical protein